MTRMGEELPMVHLKYKVGERSNFRVAITRSFARPDFFQVTCAPEASSEPIIGFFKGKEMLAEGIPLPPPMLSVCLLCGARKWRIHAVDSSAAAEPDTATAFTCFAADALPGRPDQ